MNVRGIRQELLALLLEMGRGSYLAEFVVLLTEPDGIIWELNLRPGTITGEDSVSLLFNMMPLDTHIAGSAHSHPNGVLRPSAADGHFFLRAGRFHIIIGSPYRKTDWKCYAADGKPVPLEVIT